MKLMSRILVFAAALAVSFLGSGSLGTVLSTTWSGAGGNWSLQTAAAQTAIDLGPRREGDDIALGKADAPVVLIEYASMTCPSCARFHNEVLPRLKSQFIETGQVKLIYRDFPLDRVALQAAQIARCVAPERYFGFLEILFRQQEQWTAGRDPAVMVERVKQFASLAGLPRERATACADDQAMQLRIVSGIQAAERDHKIAGTPSFVINGKRHTGSFTYDDLEKALREALRKP
jgi:protein-disulfide isomerase